MMASVPLSEDNLSASTPIQENEKRLTKSCKRYLSSPFKEIDVLSPIRKTETFKCNLFRNLNSIDISSSILTNKNKILNGVSRKLRFTELSNIIQVDNKKLDNDSGIELDRSISTYEVQNRSNSTLKDENSNFISNGDITSDSLLDNSFNSENFIKNKFRNSSNSLSQNLNLWESNCNKVTSLDILGELGLRNCTSVLSLIFSHLSDEDLRQSSYVCQKWKASISDDSKANARRKAYIKERRELFIGPEKENRFQTKYASERSHKPVSLQVINSDPVIPQQPLEFSKHLGRFDSFIQEAETVPTNVKLIKCPKCCYPSKVESGSKFCCTRNLCLHTFCQKCLGPYMDNQHSCSVPKLNSTLPKISIGSKKSKKNLRRL